MGDDYQSKTTAVAQQIARKVKETNQVADEALVLCDSCLIVGLDRAG